MYFCYPIQTKKKHKKIENNSSTSGSILGTNVNGPTNERNYQIKQVLTQIIHLQLKKKNKFTYVTMTSYTITVFICIASFTENVKVVKYL